MKISESYRRGNCSNPLDAPSQKVGRMLDFVREKWRHRAVYRGGWRLAAKDLRVVLAAGSAHYMICIATAAT